MFHKTRKSLYKVDKNNVFALYDVTQTWLLDRYRRFFLEYLMFGDGAERMSRNFGTLWIAWPLKLGPITCAETSVTNYQSTLHTFHLHRSVRLQSQLARIFWQKAYCSNKIYSLNSFGLWLQFRMLRFFYHLVSTLNCVQCRCDCSGLGLLPLQSGKQTKHFRCDLRTWVLPALSEKEKLCWEENSDITFGVALPALTQKKSLNIIVKVTHASQSAYFTVNTTAGTPLNMYNM